MSEQWIAVVGWDRFQHYADREVLWVKVYTRLHHDDRWMELKAGERAALLGIWLEYASSRAQLKFSASSLSRRLNLRVTLAQLERLVEAGFIAKVASPALARGYHDASSQALAERREERDKPKAVTPVVSERPGENSQETEVTSPEVEAEAAVERFRARITREIPF